MTSVSKATGTASRRRISWPTSVCAQPGFGVVVMCPQVGEAGFRSTGPNEPIPIASTGPSRSKKATARPIVSSGVVVGIVAVARRASGPVPDRALPLGAAGLDPAVDAHARPARRRTTGGRRTRRAGRPRGRSGPGRSMRSSSSCVLSVPNVSAGCSITVRNGYSREAYSMSSKQTSAMSSGTSRPAARTASIAPSGDEVVDREDGRRRVVQLEQPPHAFVAALRVDRCLRRPAPGRAGCPAARGRPRSRRRRSRAVETSLDSTMKPIRRWPSERRCSTSRCAPPALSPRTRRHRCRARCGRSSTNGTANFVEPPQVRLASGR